MSTINTVTQNNNNNLLEPLDRALMSEAFLRLQLAKQQVEILEKEFSQLRVIIAEKYQVDDEDSVNVNTGAIVRK